MGRSWTECVAIFEARLGRPLPPAFEQSFWARAEAALRAELRPVPAIHEALARISTPTCVASSGRLDKMRITLGLTGLWDRFEGRIFSAADVPRAKPWPDLFLHAAGMRVLGYAARTDAALLARAGAEVFSDMRALPELLSPGADSSPGTNG